MPFKFNRTSALDLILIEPDVYKDERGYFMEVYKSSEFQKAGIDKTWVQVSQSSSQKNSLRGLHYQKNPKAQGKLVSVLHGSIFDVAVDVRRGSPTFGKWTGVELNATKKNMIFIPEGFAHGFCVLSDYAEVNYLCSGEYAKDLERGIRWNDPEVNISWPVKNPLVSDKDRNLPFLKEADINFKY